MMVTATDCLALWVRLSGAEGEFDCVSQTAPGGQAIVASRPLRAGDSESRSSGVLVTVGHRIQEFLVAAQGWEGAAVCKYSAMQ
jgi:hypothetical protein